MSKKTVTMLVAAVLSGVVLVTTALAASNNVSGYEKLKASAFNVLTMENYTAEMDFSMTFDNAEFGTGYAEIKVQDKTHYSQRSSMSMMNDTSDSESYVMGDLNVYGSNGSYYSYTNSHNSYSGSDDFKMTDNQKKFTSIVFDLLAGDTKNYFTNNNGEISVRLEKNQIPELFQTGMAVISEQASREMKDSMSPMRDYYEKDDIEYQLSSMINDMNFDSVYVNAYVDENDMLKNLDFSVTISGKDDSGLTHYLTVSFTVDISDIGTTTADTIDLDKVEVKNQGDMSIYFNDDWINGEMEKAMEIRFDDETGEYMVDWQ